MNEKILLIMADGMRPDFMMDCGSTFVNEMLNDSVYTLKGRTVMPSATLPCHFSLFQSVPAERHGILTNDWNPQVRPVNGICEVLTGAGKDCGFLYSWEELRDLTRIGSLKYSLFKSRTNEECMALITKTAVELIQADSLDFIFIYLGYPDALGHNFGFTTEEYRTGLGLVWENIRAIANACKDKKEYNIIVTADHGGHDRSHGTDMPEDMTIPIIYHGRAFENLDPAKVEGSNIMDIAPTLVRAMGLKPDPEWGGADLRKADI